MKIRVECYSGHKADERPVKFWMEDAVLFIESILDQWNSSGTQYYRVRADDGNTYVLGHHEEKDAWVLESFRSEEQGVVTTDSDITSSPN
jgi:hypothetical protein